MNHHTTTIDKTWYQRLPGARERVSAGGVVLRRDHERIYVALTREADHPAFILPKGGVEPGEQLEDAARREIYEETGLRDLRLIRKLAVLERLSYNKVYWLQVHYYLFATEHFIGIPGDTQHHYAVWWFPIQELPVMFWPEQHQLIMSHHSLFTEVFADT